MRRIQYGACRPRAPFVQAPTTLLAHRVDPDGNHWVKWTDGEPRYRISTMCGLSFTNPQPVDAETAYGFCDSCLIGDLGHTVYTFTDANGAPLYVGQTKNLPKRVDEHSRTSPWWSEVKGVEYTRVARETALTAEALTIVQLNPKYNKVRPRRPSAA